MPETMSPLELWGGVECTVNRVGDVFGDQLRRSGHERRPSDLDQLAAIGFKALRYPALWERIAPHAPGANDWRWTDARLPRLRDLGLDPIVGLVHHGSGPRYTALTEDSFAPGLAAHARATAERYPWVERWTPVNEPLTTARFSALYGHWYPHAREEGTFWRALLNQIDAVRLAMAEIRQVNPRAQLVQTEDLGRTYATAGLQDQARFDNDRRWMTFDLLMGRVVEGHALWPRLAALGFARRLESIAAAPCPPDVLGVNHYLTSDRFLDGRCDLHVAASCAGNGVQPYADIEAVRVLDAPSRSLEAALVEAWGRYGAPLAVTENHNGCTREEQMRWTSEAWATALRLRRRGVDLRAVTAWSLLGSYDWDSLLTQRRGHYEPGVFDVRSGEARPTALARLLGDFAAGRRPDEPALDNVGWWRRPGRRRVVSAGVAPLRAWPEAQGEPGRPILIIDAGSAVGCALRDACHARGLAYRTGASDLTAGSGLAALALELEVLRPWAIIDASQASSLGWAERHPDACRQRHTLRAIALAGVCEARGLPYLGFSSRHVFDGAGGQPYLESDAPSPLNAYGRARMEADQTILASGERALILRSGPTFWERSPSGFAARTLRALQDGRPTQAAEEHVATPTYLPDLVNVALDLLIDREQGLWHVTHGEALSPLEFAERLAESFALDASLLSALPAGGASGPPRAPYAALGSRHGYQLPALSDAVRRFRASIAQHEPAGADRRPQSAPSREVCPV